MKEKIQAAVVSLSIFLLVISAFGYMFFPSNMLAVVGLVGNPQMNFLVRTLAVALLALVPTAWSARNRNNTAGQAHVLLGLGLYMLLSSMVDLQAHLTGIVGFASVPSIVFRVVLAGIFLWFIL